MLAKCLKMKGSAQVGRNELPAQSLARGGRPGPAQVLQLRLEEKQRVPSK